jgi:hypothetical protein
MSTLPVPVKVDERSAELTVSTNDILQLIKIGKVVVASGDYPTVRSAAQVVVRALVGREKGLSFFDALAAVYIVGGRPTFTANALAGFVKRSGRYDYRIKTLTNDLCEIVFFDRGKEVFTSSFSMEDAARANLVKGTNWRFYPRNMLFARAISNGVRWACPDLLACGAYVHGELGSDDIIDADFTPAE